MDRFVFLKFFIKKPKRNQQAGFITADFLFAFVLTISVGIFIFGLTFSLATIEVAQYIVWSSSRTYAAANKDETTARSVSTKKFNSLSKQFPLLTGQGASGTPWFELTDFTAQNHKTEPNFSSKVTDASDKLNKDGASEERQPWIGASASIYLRLFSTVNIPFLGKMGGSDPESAFKFRVYSFLIRHPSSAECRGFFQKRFNEGLKNLEFFGSISSASENTSYIVEDNGC